ncbi:hypothetical protein UlMin_013111 [Ulmus minor]
MGSKGKLSLITTLFLLISFLSASSSTKTIQKVSVDLYYETLCPDSVEFIVNDLVKLFKYGFVPLINLNLVPYGNAKLRSNNSIVCQHGPNECLLNTVEACAINIWPDLALVYERNYTNWESCFEKLGLDPKPITDCYTGEYGKELELQYAAETNALQPPHQYVPWVVVDGQPLYEEYEDFLSYICEAYKGIVVPETCAKLSLDTIKMKGARPSHPVTYKGKAKMPALQARIRSAIASWMNQKNLAAE